MEISSSRRPRAPHVIPGAGASRSVGRRFACAVGVAGLLTSIMPSTAAASEVSGTSQQVTYAAEPGEVNNVAFGRRTVVSVWPTYIHQDVISVTDTGASITTGSGCVPTGTNSANCTDAYRVVATLGDGDDTVKIYGTHTVIDGGPGADTFYMNWAPSPSITRPGPRPSTPPWTESPTTARPGSTTMYSWATTSGFSVDWPATFSTEQMTPGA